MKNRIAELGATTDRRDFAHIMEAMQGSQQEYDLLFHTSERYRSTDNVESILFDKTLHTASWRDYMYACLRGNAYPDASAYSALSKPPNTEQATERRKQYETLSVMGKGAISTVHVARLNNVGVAFKVLNPESRLALDSLPRFSGNQRQMQGANLISPLPTRGVVERVSHHLKRKSTIAGAKKQVRDKAEEVENRRETRFLEALKRSASDPLLDAVSNLWNRIRESNPGLTYVPLLSMLEDSGLVLTWDVNEYHLEVEVQEDGQLSLFYLNVDTQEAWTEKATMAERRLPKRLADVLWHFSLPGTYTRMMRYVGEPY